MIGSLIGGYRVVTELGSGPSGSVYYAEHPLIGRRAAIKVLSPELSCASERLDRFIKHLKVIGGIRHPNIVDVLDIGQTPGRVRGEARGEAGGELTFLVMEMLEGESLDERLEREGALGEAAAIRVLAQVASAVGAAHDRGLVHAALKPGNIFITNGVDYPEFVKVLDFGSHLLYGPGGSSTEQAPGFLAPELLAGAQPDEAADVYAVGALAFAMLAGRPPWGLAPAPAPAPAHAHAPAHDPGSRDAAVDPGDRPPPPSPIPLHEARPGLSKPLSDVIMRAIARDPSQRWPSLRELRRAIERAVASGPAPAAAAGLPASFAVPHPVGPATTDEIRRTEKVQAKKVGRALSHIILRRIGDNRLQLPSMPEVAIRCLEVLGDPDVTFIDVARVIEQDPVIATRVLQVINSAAYARRDAVKTLEQAVSQIGVKPMRILLVEQAACQIFTSRSAGIRQQLMLTWEHCLAVGMLARDLAERLRSRVDPDVAYLGGLLHDVGKPVIGGLLLEAERQLVEELDVPWMTETLWQKTVAESHRSVGATIAAAWKLPAEVCEAIESCDAYDEPGGPHACGNLVRFANSLAKREGIYVGDVSADEIIAAILRGRGVLGVDQGTESRLIASLRERTGAITGASSARPTDRIRRLRPV